MFRIAQHEAHLISPWIALQIVARSRFKSSRQRPCPECVGRSGGGLLTDRRLWTNSCGRLAGPAHRSAVVVGYLCVTLTCRCLLVGHLEQHDLTVVTECMAPPEPSAVSTAVRSAIHDSLITLCVVVSVMSHCVILLATPRVHAAGTSDRRSSQQRATSPGMVQFAFAVLVDRARTPCLRRALRWT
jgi:hypothetical protein